MPGIEGLLRGRTLGSRYRVEEVIGRGGMGAVYRATDERLGRQVALKVVIVGGGDEDEEDRERLRARFQREARAAAMLPHHPNVVPVYDYGTDPELGLDYIVMELLRGEDLSTLFGRAGSPPLSTGLRILYEAARGVAVGHRAGMIHRDVKPGNIFLARAGDGEAQVRVLDFGIAKLADDDTLSQLTQDGRVPHSPAYASPEQLRGLSELGPPSDVFSLGAVGYQLLTGERPFSEQDRNRMALGMPVPPPSLRERNPAIPSEVDKIVQRALAWDAPDRFADAGVMADALGSVLRGLPERPVEPYAAIPFSTHPPGTGEIRPSVPDEDERTQLIPPSGAPGRAGANAGAPPDDRTLAAPPPPSAPRREPPPRRPPPEEPRRSRAFWWALLLLVGFAGVAFAVLASQGGGGRTAAVDEIPEAPLSDTLDVVLEPEQPEVTLDEVVEEEPDELDAVINHREGQRFYQAGQYDSALVQFRRAVEIAPENPTYRYDYGLTLRRLDRPEQAAEQLQRSLQLGVSNRTSALVNLGLAQLQLGDTALAISSLSRALDADPTVQQAGMIERILRDVRGAQQGAQPAPPGRAADTVPAAAPARVPRPDTAARGVSPTLRRILERDTLPPPGAPRAAARPARDTAAAAG